MPYLLEHKRVLSLVIALSLMGSLSFLAQPLLLGQVIARVSSGQLFDGLIWGLIGLVIVAALISGFQHYLLQRTGDNVVLSIRRHLVGRMLYLPVTEFDTRRTGDLVSRVGTDTTMLRTVLTQGLVDTVGGSLTIIGALIAMAIIDPLLLGLTLLSIVVAIVVVVTLARRIRVASKEAARKVGELTAAVERAISGVRTIRAANATDREINGVLAEAEGAWLMGIKVARISALVIPIAGIALQVALLTVLSVGGYRLAEGALSIAQLVTFVLFLFMMIMPLGQAFRASTSVYAALGALARIQEIIALPIEGEHDRDVPLNDTPGGAGASVATSTTALEFENVFFTYPVATDADESTTNPVVLNGVNFRVNRGMRAALVGPSGAGKSTILGLIERFYDPTSGTIRVGGLDIRGLERTDLRAQIGYVEQDAPVLAGSLRDNLLLGAPEATDEQCIAVLHEVNLGSVLDRSPLGLGAPVGEEGVMLSGGERQRLAIARALLAAPPILLLDESTSSLDGANEKLMRLAIDRISQDRTLLVIAHRLSTVVDSDMIIVLEEGAVVGVGTHSDLVNSTPLYRELAMHQLLV